MTVLYLIATVALGAGGLPADSPSAVAGAVLAPDPATRLLAADRVALLSSARAAAALVLLAGDPVVEVRVAALEASAARCRRGEGAPCTMVLARFVEDGADEVSWLARDLLLPYDARSALTGASPAYKVDAISSLAVLAERGERAAAIGALELLALDLDAEVSERARNALAQVQP